MRSPRRMIEFGTEEDDMIDNLIAKLVRLGARYAAWLDRADADNRAEAEALAARGVWWLI